MTAHIAVPRAACPLAESRLAAAASSADSGPFHHVLGAYGGGGTKHALGDEGYLATGLALSSAPHAELLSYQPQSYDLYFLLSRQQVPGLLVLD